MSRPPGAAGRLRAVFEGERERRRAPDGEWEASAVLAEELARVADAAGREDLRTRLSALRELGRVLEGMRVEVPAASGSGGSGDGGRGAGSSGPGDRMAGLMGSGPVGGDGADG